MRIRLSLPWLASVALTALLTVILGGWAVTLSAPRPVIAPAPPAEPLPVRTDGSAIAPLFGALAIQSDPVSATMPNLKVQGILVREGQGVALISVDGKPARAWAVGEAVAPGLTLSGVDARAVTLTRAGGESISLPAPARSSTAILSSGPAPAGSSVSPPAMSPGREPLPTNNELPSQLPPGYPVPVMPSGTR